MQQHPASNIQRRDPDELVSINVLGEFQVAAPIAPSTRVSEVGEQLKVPLYMALDLRARKLAQFA